MRLQALLGGTALVLAMSAGAFAQTAAPSCLTPAQSSAAVKAAWGAKMAAGEGGIARQAAGEGGIARQAAGEGGIARQAAGEGGIAKQAAGEGGIARQAAGEG